MNDWKTRWGNFFKILTTPLVLIVTVTTITLAVLLIKQTDPNMIAALTVLNSLFAGVLGELFGSRWREITEEKVLTARGKSATRDLKLLLRSVTALETRVQIYIKKYSQSNPDTQEESQLVLHYLEEIVERCNILEEQVINATENWIDVVPETADISTQIGVITDLKEEVSALQASYQDVTEELELTKDKSSEEMDELRRQKSAIQSELYKTRQELRDKIRSSGVTFAPSLRASPAGGVSRLLHQADIPTNGLVQLDNPEEPIDLGIYPSQKSSQILPISISEED